jgi:hypothetical protein
MNKHLEKNVAKLLESAFRPEFRPDEKITGEVLQILRNRISNLRKETEPSFGIILALSGIWLVALVFILTVKLPENFVFGWMKGLMGLSLLLLPFTGLLLMFLKMKYYEEKLD